MNTTLITSADQLTQDHYDVLARAVQTAQTGSDAGWQDNQPFDDTGEAFGAAENITATLEPLSAFAGKTWREASGRQDFEIDGCQCLYWQTAQALKGQPRCSVTVVDFGGLRLVYQT